MNETLERLPFAVRCDAQGEAGFDALLRLVRESESSLGERLLIHGAILFRGWLWTSNAPTSGNSVTITPKPRLARVPSEAQSVPDSGLARSRSEPPQPTAMNRANSVQAQMRRVRSVSLMRSSVAQHPLERGS